MPDPDPTGNTVIAVLLSLLFLLLTVILSVGDEALGAVGDARVRELEEDGDRRARRLSSLTAVPARFLATIQVAITLAGFLGSAYAADHFAEPLVGWLTGLGIGLSA